MSPTRMEQLFAKLNERRLEVRRRLLALEARADTGPDVDRATPIDAQGVQGALGEQERRELAEIDAALERLERHAFGTCESCGEPISPKRLEAIPETRVCLACSAGMAALA